MRTLFFIGSQDFHTIIITTNQSIQLTKNVHVQSEISLDRKLILSYLYGLIQNPYFFKKWIVDAIYVGLSARRYSFEDIKYICQVFLAYQILKCVYGTPYSSNVCPQIHISEKLGLNSKTSNGLLFYKINRSTVKYGQKKTSKQRYNRYPFHLLEDLIIHQRML